MTDVERFLSQQELFKCERLSASITKNHCKENKSSGRVMSCSGCPGLGERIEMTQGVKQQPTTAASGKSVQPHRLCDVPGCNKFRVIGHKCTNHSKEFLTKTEPNKIKLVKTLVNKEEIEQVKQPVMLSKAKSNEPTKASVEPISEPINHPAYYGGDSIYEAIKVIEAWGLGFSLGNTVKYISRSGKKDNGLEDLKKAAWYLNREIERLSA